jgi:poly-gamma-glutamate capsule biosynthesis protein CapA/YwtB (metallophosphatase superfamily)
MMKITILISAYLFILACTSKNKNEDNKVNKLTNNTETEHSLQPATPDTISINAVGDIMFGTNFPDLKNMPPNGGKDLLTPFTSLLKDADVTFGNAEGVFLNSGGTPKGSGGQVYCFRQPTYMAQYFLDNGFDLLSVANNHVADFGDVGLKSTDSVLRKLPIDFAGSTIQPTTIITVKGIKYGLAAFAPNKGCVDLNNIANAIKIVKELKQKCHIVMVSFHGGAEGIDKQHVTKKTEIFYGQNRGNVYDFAHKVIDAGADMVIGHGPHVARAMELYKNKFSLGGVSGNAALLKLFVTEKGDFVQAKIISGKQYGEGGPVLDEQNKEVFNTIKNLTLVDFPNSGLKFEDGMVFKN